MYPTCRLTLVTLSLTTSKIETPLTQVNGVFFVSTSSDFTSTDYLHFIVVDFFSSSFSRILVIVSHLRLPITLSVSDFFALVLIRSSTIIFIVQRFRLVFSSRMKREAGENPARGRRCNRPGLDSDPTASLLAGRGIQAGMSRKPEDLPWDKLVQCFGLKHKGGSRSSD
jgi:hypothetical protein